MKPILDFFTDSRAANVISFGSFVVSFIALIVSVLTLILGFKAFKKFLVQHAAIQQLDLVLELIQKIHATKINLTIINKTEESQGRTYFEKNLFEFSALGNLSKKFDYRIYIPIHYEFEFSSWRELDNPLLPSGIANALSNFYGHFIFSMDDLDNQSEFMVIGKEKETSENKMNNFSLMSFEGGLRQFTKDCKNIRNEISEWLNKHGVKDINKNIINREFSFF